jgi:DNA-directed RNA polymerase specialized sigma24 family protein
MKVSDIAHALGVTGGTVKTLLFRARQRLRQTLETTSDDSRQEERT